jgi:hypothetical protein
MLIDYFVLYLYVDYIHYIHMQIKNAILQI